MCACALQELPVEQGAVLITHSIRIVASRRWPAVGLLQRRCAMLLWRWLIWIKRRLRMIRLLRWRPGCKWLLCILLLLRGRWLAVPRHVPTGAVLNTPQCSNDHIDSRFQCSPDLTMRLILHTAILVAHTSACTSVIPFRSCNHSKDIPANSSRLHSISHTSQLRCLRSARRHTGRTALTAQ